MFLFFFPDSIKNKNSFLKTLDDTESWLYSEEAETQEKSVYMDRLNKLKVNKKKKFFFKKIQK